MGVNRFWDMCTNPLKTHTRSCASGEDFYPSFCQSRTRPGLQSNYKIIHRAWPDTVSLLTVTLVFVRGPSAGSGSELPGGTLLVDCAARQGRTYRTRQLTVVTVLRLVARRVPRRLHLRRVQQRTVVVRIGASLVLRPVKINTEILRLALVAVVVRHDQPVVLQPVAVTASLAAPLHVYRQ